MTAPYEVWCITKGVASLVFCHADRKRAVTALAVQRRATVCLAHGRTVLAYGVETTAAQQAALKAAVIAAHPDAEPIIAPKPGSAPPPPPRVVLRRRDRDEEADDSDAPAEAEHEPVAEEPVAEEPVVTTERDRWSEPPPAVVAPKAQRKPVAPKLDLAQRALLCVTKAGGIERLERIVAAIGGAR